MYFSRTVRRGQLTDIAAKDVEWLPTFLFVLVAIEKCKLFMLR